MKHETVKVTKITLFITFSLSPSFSFVFVHAKISLSRKVKKGRRDLTHPLSLYLNRWLLPLRRKRGRLLNLSHTGRDHPNMLFRILSWYRNCYLDLYVFSVITFPITRSDASSTSKFPSFCILD